MTEIFANVQFAISQNRFLLKLFMTISKVTESKKEFEALGLGDR